MRNNRDERHISVRSSIGQYATLGGLLVLLVGLGISFLRPGWSIPLLVSMALGFSLSVVGGFFASQPRPSGTGWLHLLPGEDTGRSGRSPRRPLDA